LITDRAALESVRESWKGAAALRELVQRQVLWAFANGAVGLGALADIAHNLALLQSCSVLNDALEQLRDEEKFQAKGRTLGILVEASVGAIPWLDLPLIRSIVVRRNEIAHGALVLTRAECWAHSDAIEAQLRAWGILT
jgi:hypothetical protein